MNKDYKNHVPTGESNHSKFFFYITSPRYSLLEFPSMRVFNLAMKKIIVELFCYQKKWNRDSVSDFQFAFVSSFSLCGTLIFVWEKLQQQQTFVGYFQLPSNDFRALHASKHTIRTNEGKRILFIFVEMMRTGHFSSDTQSNDKKNIDSANALIYYENMKLCFGFHQQH